MIDNRFIEQKMREKRITYRKMAELLDFRSPATFWKWINGRTQMKAVYLERLAEILDVPIQNLFIQSDASQTPCSCNEEA
jgi:transcriptional regulator with XRE-family HTH domain